MTTSRDDLIGFVENLYIPQLPSAGLISVIRTAQEAIEASILLFASGRADEQPNLVSWMSQRELLEDDALDEAPGESVMADNYGSHLNEINAKRDEMEQQNSSVEDSVFETFSLTDATFSSIENRVGTLDSDLRSINQRVDEDGHYLPLTAAEEARAMSYALHAVDDVQEIVDDASLQVQARADKITGSAPSVLSASSSDGSVSPVSAAGYSAQPADLYASAGADRDHDGIVGAAANEIGVGETDPDFPYKPYSLDGQPWCAAFATWTWEKAGYNVDWTNKNYVPDIWKDAIDKKLAGKTSTAKAGDMIIFDWEGDGEPDHVGIVASVGDDGTISTIEGNTSDDMVETNNYPVGEQQNIVGVVKPPST
ncbi:CHAP domain-containing protein [Nocardia pneumoniae]|uniref:CHAP domain-containing protein n=1 Tax=Nocardia pneumoniae TaxID=228601 RepID=UPI00030428A6|nr:CHAP domain-containing protein [Nocardia pneumoniae]